jgi:CopG antitoxin of type II toxin-antitoxin system
MSAKTKTRKPDPPVFATREEEAEFWETHSSADYHWEPLEVELADPVMLSVRIDLATMERLRAAAARHGETVSGLIRTWALQRLVLDEAEEESDPSALLTRELIDHLSATVVAVMKNSPIAKSDWPAKSTGRVVGRRARPRE